MPTSHGFSDRNRLGTVQQAVARCPARASLHSQDHAIQQDAGEWADRRGGRM